MARKTHVPRNRRMAKRFSGTAGLGETAQGTEPADWMSAVLRGRRLSLEQSLGVIADASKRTASATFDSIAGRRGSQLIT